MHFFKSILKLISGMIILYFGLALSLKLNLGVAPNDALFSILSNISNIEVGSISILGSCIYLLVAIIIYGKKFPKRELLQFIFIFCSGMLLNFLMYHLFKDFNISNIYIRILLYIITVFLKVIGVVFILNSNIMKTSLETMCEAIAYKLNKNMPIIRQIVDIIYIILIIILEIIIKNYSFIGIGTILDLILFSQLLRVLNRLKFKNLIKQRRKKNDL